MGPCCMVSPVVRPALARGACSEEPPSDELLVARVEAREAPAGIAQDGSEPLQGP